jgi:hypothetical protein
MGTWKGSLKFGTFLFRSFHGHLRLALCGGLRRSTLMHAPSPNVPHFGVERPRWECEFSPCHLFASSRRGTLLVGTPLTSFCVQLAG